MIMKTKTIKAALYDGGKKYASSPIAERYAMCFPVPCKAKKDRDCRLNAEYLSFLPLYNWIWERHEVHYGYWGEVERGARRAALGKRVRLTDFPESVQKMLQQTASEMTWQHKDVLYKYELV